MCQSVCLKPVAHLQKGTTFLFQCWGRAGSCPCWSHLRIRGLCFAQSAVKHSEVCWLRHGDTHWQIVSLHAD